MNDHNPWAVIAAALFIGVCVALFIAYAKAVWATDLPWFIKIRLI